MVHKIHQLDPMLITCEESEGVDTVEGTLPRLPCDWLNVLYVNFYLANRGIVMLVFGDLYDTETVKKMNEIFPKKTYYSYTSTRNSS